ncbi:MAG: M56 family metallopeptidase [Lachnospiraceae bacterium]|nr:M56 family metallopeptidase [Lachnospiraceae bacterium]
MHGILVELFLDLLEVNIVAAVIIIVLGLFAGKLRKRYGAGWMKAVWILLAVRLLIPYNFSIMSLAGISFMGTGPQGSIPASETGVNADIASMPVSTDDKELQNTSDSIGQNTTLQNHIGQTMNGESTKEKESTVIPAEKQTITDGAISDEKSMRVRKFTSIFPPAGFRYAYVEILTRIWIMGVAVCVIYTVVGYLMFLGKYQKSLCPVEDERLKEVIFRTGNGVPAFQCKEISSPMLIGIMNPMLVIPPIQKRWTAAEIELIVAHEFCHYRKKDLLLKLLMTLVCCVNWMNPAVYYMRKQFFYNIELACDETILRGRDLEERTLYARMMLSFAGAGNRISAFSSSFLGDKEQLKGRIDNMFDSKTKKRGFVSAVMVCIAFPIMGLVVSCGYQTDDTAQTDTNISETASTEIESEKETGTDSQTAVGQSDIDSFDYNNEYNEIIRVYKNDVYLAKENGIYYIKDGQGEGALLYQDGYRLRRGMEIDQNYLYFCGSAPGSDEFGATIYRMDLDTQEVVDALAAFSQKFESLYNISIYEGKLYAASDYGSRIGFELDPNGGIVRQLDERADDFLYKEYNDYVELEWKMNWDTEYDSEEYWNLAKQLEEKYIAAMDVASCKKLLNGSQVVSKYKNEAMRSFYLKKEDGSYELLCDTSFFPPIIAESGMYYFDERNRIWYVDYETRQPELVYENQSREWSEVNMINYDADYLYAVQGRTIGYDAEGYRVAEMYLIRIPRAGGDTQKVYRFENPDEYPEIGGSWYGHCAVYHSKKMYLEQLGVIDLDPDANGMQRINAGEPCEDAVEMRQTVETFAAAYFENDETVLRSLLTEDFAGTADLYPYPENAAQITENYLAGLPDDNIEIGVTCPLIYEFSGHAESDGAYVYLSMEVTRTEDGFRVRSYGLEQ